MRYSPGLVLVASFCSAFLAAPLLVRADPDSVEQCFLTGCSTALSILKPCGGSGITNSSLDVNAIYIPTASLGGCQCNYFFHQQLSSCLSCIADLSVNKPEIQKLDGWTQACQGYGYNMTSEPVVTSADDNMASDQSGGLSKGAIIGIVIGALVLLALIGAILFLRSRKRRQLKSVGEESALGANAPGGAVAIGSGSHHYGTEDDYCLDHQHAGYNDPSGQQQQHPSADYPNGAYYGANGNHDTMMMQNISNNNNDYAPSPYVPPPPHPASTTIQTTTIPSSVSTTAVGYIAASRPSDSYPQSLRSRPTGWDHEKQEPLSSLLSTDHSLHHDKAEYDEGEELEPPRSRGRFASEDDHHSRRSMTPPRASLQNYRDEFRRPSIPSLEWEPRRGGSDRGSVLNMLHVESSNGDVEPHDSPDESARRRARAAELFSAESPRR
ncbi:MAG: hypothetical protein J3Q66DRAFT_403118 [Benniella sp.]|nr:MAG: hypothetical protein J3Q66DRAFT_403118 [Benniella sp.]